MSFSVEHCRVLTADEVRLLAEIERDKKSNYRSIADWLQRGYRDAKGIPIVPRH